MIVMVRAIQHYGGAWRAAYQYRHPHCVDEGEHIESWDCHPEQPNRHAYASDEDYELALAEQFTCGRCGQSLTDLGGRAGDGSGSASGAGDVWGAGTSWVTKHSDLDSCREV